MVLMLFADFFIWWYGHGWTHVFTNIPRRFQRTLQAFSIVVLLETLFSPWRRIITPPGANIAEHLRAFGDNLISRGVGFVVRLFVLLAGVLALVLIAALSLVEIIVWPLAPIAAVVFLVKGILG